MNDERYKLAHRLQGMVNAMGEDIAKDLEGAFESIAGKITLLASKAEQTESLVRKKQLLEKQRAEIQKVLNEIYSDIEKGIKAKTVEVGKAGPKIVNDIITKSLPSEIKIEFSVPKLTKNQVLLWYESFQAEGNFFPQWMKKLSENSAQRIIKETTQSMILNESIRETTKRIQKALSAGRHGAEAIAQTAIFGAYAHAERESFIENKGIIKGVRYQVEFDRRTCPQCAPLDQQEYFPVDNAPHVPIHFRCRCYLEPIFRDKRIEKAIEGKRIARLDTEKRTVKHRDGTTSTKYEKLRVKHVPETMSYNDWMLSMIKSKDPRDVAFAREALGRTRFKLISSGKLKMDSLYYQGKLINIDELKELSK